MPLPELREVATQLRSVVDFFLTFFVSSCQKPFIEALESVDFDPVSVFWENQQNSDDSVFNNSVTGTQSKKRSPREELFRTV